METGRQKERKRERGNIRSFFPGMHEGAGEVVWLGGSKENTTRSHFVQFIVVRCVCWTMGLSDSKIDVTSFLITVFVEVQRVWMIYSHFWWLDLRNNLLTAEVEAELLSKKWENLFQNPTDCSTRRKVVCFKLVWFIWCFSFSWTLTNTMSHKACMYVRWLSSTSWWMWRVYERAGGSWFVQTCLW